MDRDYWRMNSELIRRCGFQGATLNYGDLTEIQ